MATTRKTGQPSATFGIVGKGPVTVRGDGVTVSLTTDTGLVLTLMVAEARVLARRLIEECGGDQ